MGIENIGIATTNRIIDLITSSWYEVWVGVSGYDTRPYIPAIGREAKIPCNYEVGYAQNGLEGHTVEVIKKEVEEVIRGLHASMKAIVIPDYYGMNREGEYVYTPCDKGWGIQYLSD
jgi:hypothetical protein